MLSSYDMYTAAIFQEAGISMLLRMSESDYTVAENMLTLILFRQV
jgi:ketopantoate hydroxymethyltransferase